MSSDAKRLERLEAFEAIRLCVFRYALASDRGNDGTITRGLFTESASFEALGFGSFQGREAIVPGLEKIARDAVKWAFHIPGGPLITLADDLLTATVFWWAWVPVVLRQEDKDVPYWGAGHYQGDLVRTPNDGPAGWQFQRLRFEPKFQTPFNGPWTVLEGDFHWPK